MNRAIETVLRIETDDARKTRITVNVHDWPRLGHRAAGSIVVRGCEGSYQVLTIDTETGTEFVRYTGGFEHALVNAFRLRKRFSENGLE